MFDNRKLWRIARPQKEKAQIIAGETGLSELVALVLANRGYDAIESIQKFLNPEISSLYSPFLLKGMEKAIERIRQEIVNRGKILIYGDYDVDGITSTCILYDYLKGCGANVDFYIPDRFGEGYGLSMIAVNNLLERKPALIITVDNGISAVNEISYLKSEGIDVIITDHHECGDVLPAAFSVINPKQAGCEYPFKFLAGVGVAFKLIQGLAFSIDGSSNSALKYLDLVCVGTIADIVPLVDENRILVKHGLEAVAASNNIGLKALFQEAGAKEFNTWTIGFAIAPRINAAGRLGGAGRAVELFTTDNLEKAKEIAKELNQENKNRQEIEAKVLEEVMKKIIDQGLEKDNILVVDGENWHHGVIGIVASRVTDKYHKPCMLISFEEGIGRGSGRSIQGFNIFDALSKCSHLLEKFGGHELAGGLTIHQDKLSEFKAAIKDIANCLISQTQLSRAIDIEAKITREYLSLEAVSELRYLEPFGIGNPVPLFCIENLQIDDIRTVGDNKHLKLCLNSEGHKVDAIGFRMADAQKIFEAGDIIEVACEVDINQFAGRSTVQLKLKDLRLNQESAHEELYYKTFHLEHEQASSIEEASDNNIYFRERETYIKKLINSGESNIFFVNTLQVSKYLLSTFEHSYGNVTGDTGIYYNNYEHIQKNLLIINPIVDQIDFSIFDNIVLCDAFFRLDYYDTINKKCLNKKIFVLYDEEDFKYNTQVLEEITLERSHLTAIYRYLKNNCQDGKLRFDDQYISKIISRDFSINLNPFIFKKGLDIFQELNLINKTAEGTSYQVELMYEGTEKSSLEDSKQFVTALNYKHQFENVTKFLKENRIIRDY